MSEGARGGGRGSICLVAGELSTLFLNGGIGTYFHLLAHLLARHGWRVHILYCGHIHDHEALAQAPRRLAQAGISFSNLAAYELAPLQRITSRHQMWYLQTSHKVRHALADLHRLYHFDLVEFADMHAPGFATIQAQRAGLALRDAWSLVKLHASSPWLREGAMQWMTGAADLKLDYCERYAFENADAQLSPSLYMLDYMRGCGWAVRPEAWAGQPYPEAEFEPPVVDAATPELVFFGRLETRKGLEIFVDAVRKLPADVPITFLGKDHVVRDGTPSVQYLRARMGERPHRLLTDHNRARALAYLAEGNRLAVIPSLAETFGYTVAECAVNGIPFLAARAGGIPEILRDADLQDRLLFDPDASNLVRCLKRYLRSSLTERAELCDRVAAAADPRVNNQRVADHYAELLDRKAATAKACSLPAQAGPGLPRVSVAVAYYNLGSYLPELLASLAAQTYADLEVIIVDDGSTCPSSVRVLEEQRRLYPHFRFLSQPNGGPGAARNRGLAEATGEYFVTVDADNICRPLMIECFAQALAASPGVSALTCYLLGFRKTEDIERLEFVFEYCPPGGPHVMASFENVYGDTNAIFRAADLRAVGGYITDRTTPWEDWQTFVKLVNQGYSVGVVPEPLLYYRVRDDSRLREMTEGWSNLYRPTQNLLRNVFIPIEQLAPAERYALWTALVSFHKRTEQLDHHATDLRHHLGHHQQHAGHLEGELTQHRQHAHDLEEHLRHHQIHIVRLERDLALAQTQIGRLETANRDLEAALRVMRYRLVDRLNRNMKRMPLVQRTVKRSIYLTWKAWKGIRLAPLLPARLVRRVVTRDKQAQN